MPGLLDVPVEVRSIILRYAIEPSYINVCDHNRLSCSHSRSSIRKLVTDLLTTPHIICKTITAEMSMLNAIRKLDMEFCTFGIVKTCLGDLPLSMKARIRSLSHHAPVVSGDNDEMAALINQIRKERLALIMGKEVSLEIVEGVSDHLARDWIKIVVTDLES